MEIDSQKDIGEAKAITFLCQTAAAVQKLVGVIKMACCYEGSASKEDYKQDRSTIHKLNSGSQVGSNKLLSCAPCPAVAENTSCRAHPHTADPCFWGHIEELLDIVEDLLAGHTDSIFAPHELHWKAAVPMWSPCSKASEAQISQRQAEIRFFFTELHQCHAVNVSIVSPVRSAAGEAAECF